MRAKGLLFGYQITDEGNALASTYAERKPTGADLREWLRPKLNKCENEILDVLFAARGERLDSASIGAGNLLLLIPREIFFNFTYADRLGNNAERD